MKRILNNKERYLSHVCQLIIRLLGYFILVYGRLSMTFYKSQSRTISKSNDLDNEVIMINSFRTFPTPIDQFIHSKYCSSFLSVYNIENLLNKK